jgi:hypothetical protein
MARLTDQDLRLPPSNRFEKLSGKLRGYHSIRVNRKWRLVFRWDGERGEASQVYLDDHSYRWAASIATWMSSRLSAVRSECRPDTM